jgi:hypothetical protein
MTTLKQLRLASGYLVNSILEAGFHYLKLKMVL